MKNEARKTESVLFSLTLENVYTLSSCVFICYFQYAWTIFNVWVYMFGIVDCCCLNGLHMVLSIQTAISSLLPWKIEMSLNSYTKKWHVEIVFQTHKQPQSLDWLKGTFRGTPSDLMGQNMVSCRFPLQPIQWQESSCSSPLRWKPRYVLMEGVRRTGTGFGWFLLLATG